MSTTELKLNGTTVLSENAGVTTLSTAAAGVVSLASHTTQVSNVSGTAGNINFTTPNAVNTFTVKTVDAAITDSQTGTAPDTTNNDSGQLAIYNGATKLWGITEGGLIQNPNRPAFYVRNTTGASAFAASSVMTWDEIHFNIGNHFSNGTTFTAPIDGIYFFSSMILSNVNSRVFHRLRKNGSGIAGAYTESYSGSSYQTVTISIVYQLNAGDYVDSYCHNNAAYGNNYANFNGCLIG